MLESEQIYICFAVLDNIFSALECGIDVFDSRYAEFTFTVTHRQFSEQDAMTADSFALLFGILYFL
jgi:hypothetical protein